MAKQTKAAMFQFLIGTIQTSGFRDGVHLLRVRVSIPHRYDPNPHDGRMVRIAVVGFQFLIGTIQTIEKVGGWQ